MSTPSTQRAVINNGADKPIAFVDNYAVPSIKSNQVLVQVVAASLNPVDWKLHAYNFFGLSTPFVLGYDFSGVVVQVGADVKDFKVGDEVVGAPPINEAGAFAEYYAADAIRLAHKPANVSHQQAATLGIAYLSAYDGLFNHVKAGDVLYVPGGAGGVSHFAVQIGKQLGAKVITSASRKEGLDLLKSYGADHVFNYKEHKAADEVSKFTGGKGADAAYDATYQTASFEECIAALKTNGKLIVLGGTNVQPENSPVTQALKAKNGEFVLADLPRYSVNRSHDQDVIVAGFKFGLQSIADGKVKPHIESVVALNEVPAILEKMSKGYSPIGKIVALIKQ